MVWRCMGDQIWCCNSLVCDCRGCMVYRGRIGSLVYRILLIVIMNACSVE